jgi:hypothetical protein|tara:strand:+ start:1319 stop:1597 length:279 start_codon:yes stop_codon:yes gene_type:complete
MAALEALVIQANQLDKAIAKDHLQIAATLLDQVAAQVILALVDGIQEREAKDLEVAKREVVHHTRVQEVAEQAVLAVQAKEHTVVKVVLEDL